MYVVWKSKLLKKTFESKDKKLQETQQNELRLEKRKSPADLEEQEKNNRP